ncbi:MAG: SMC-Scp complex subunit ScpB [Pseudomonadota bacterium]
MPAPADSHHDPDDHAPDIPSDLPSAETPSAQMLPEGETFELAVRLAEALLFIQPDPVSPKQLRQLLPIGSDIPAVMDHLSELYRARGIQVCAVAGGWAMRTAADLRDYLRQGHIRKKPLPRAAMETLAIIAYHQPITRPEIDHIRGVVTGQQIFETLMNTGWVATGGRREAPGRPLVWITTPAFLDHFNLQSTQDLPDLEVMAQAGFLQPPRDDEKQIPFTLAQDPDESDPDESDPDENTGGEGMSDSNDDDRQSPLDLASPQTSRAQDNESIQV